jgi:hypothetical protein
MPVSKKAIVKKTAKAIVKKVAKKAAKKAVKKEKELIKYEDKSKGQPELVIIFNRIKEIMMPYANGSIKAHGGSGGKLLLISHKPLEIQGRKRDELWFTSILIQKGYVGFYFMPIYGYKKLGEQIHPQLMKCLKGKACFHIKKNDEELYAQITEVMKLGYEAYKKSGWVD